MKNIKKIGTLAIALTVATAAQAQLAKTFTSSSTHSMTVTTTHGGTLMIKNGGENNQLPKDDLFAGTEIFAKGASDVTEITMDPDSLDMVSGSNKHSAHTMVLNIVRTYSYEKPGMYDMAEVEKYRSKLSTGDWHCSVHIRELKNGESTDVCNKRRTDGMVEEAIITVEPKELTFIHTIRKGGDGKSEVDGFPAMSSLNNFPALAMVTDVNMAKLQAKLQVLSAMDLPTMQAVMPHVMADGENVDIQKLQMIVPDNGHMPKSFFLEIEPDAKVHVDTEVHTKVKTLKILPAPGTTIPYEAAPAPEVAPAPEAAPAPAAP